MRKIVALALTLALLSLAVGALAEGFSFRNGVTWSSTPEDVMAAERGNEVETEEYPLEDGKTTFAIEVDDVSAAGAEADAHYIFVEDALLVCGYVFDEDDITVERLEQALSTKYGDSAPADIEYVNTLMGAIGGGGADADDTCVCWSLEDGTLIALTDTFGDIQIAYMNAPQLLALGEKPVEEDVINTDGL